MIRSIGSYLWTLGTRDPCCSIFRSAWRHHQELWRCQHCLCGGCQQIWRMRTSRIRCTGISWSPIGSGIWSAYPWIRGQLPFSLAASQCCQGQHRCLSGVSTLHYVSLLKFLWLHRPGAHRKNRIPRSHATWALPVGDVGPKQRSF